MVRDVVDTLETSAASQLHTHALYSVFLRALISARIDQNHVGEPSKDEISNLDQNHIPSQDMHQGIPQAAYPSEPTYLMEFNFNSEMGPVADMSTFPPTMAPMPAEDHTSVGLTMDNILSSGFWDSMLVPGK